MAKSTSRTVRCSFTAATLVVSAASIAMSSAFTLPSSPKLHHESPPRGSPNNSNRLQCSRRQQQHRWQHHPLFVQSKDSVFTTAAENGTDVADDDGDKDARLLLAAHDLTEVLRNESPMPEPIAASYGETDPLAVDRIERVYTTSEEASIYMADAPVARSEGASVSEESALASDGLFWRGAVVVLCALWASNFACAKVVLAQPGVDASLYAVARFSLAAASLLPGAINAARKGAINWETARGALLCGSWVTFGYLGQTIGLMTTTPSRSCVICSLNCIFVAIVAEFMRVKATEERGYKTDFDLKKLIPAMIAVTGVAIIELKGAGGDPTIGDLISFSQPIGFGMGYLILEDLMHKQPSAALPVSAIKLAVVATGALLFFEASPHAVADLATSPDVDVLLEGAKQSSLMLKVPDFTPILSSPLALGAICYTGLVTTSLALWVESVAFQRVPATDASIILTTEPLFAAATSAVLVGETFGPSDAVGAFFIVGACIYAIKMGEAEELCDEETKECEVVEK